MKRKRLLLVTLFLLAGFGLTSLTGCFIDDPARMRVQNDDSVAVHVTVGDHDYGIVQPGEVTEYASFEQMEWYSLKYNGSEVDTLIFYKSKSFTLHVTNVLTGGGYISTP